MKTLQISAAPQWNALFEDDGEAAIVPLAAWAIVEGKTGNEITGLIVAEQCGQVLERADGADNFVGYIHDSERELAPSRLKELGLSKG